MTYLLPVAVLLALPSFVVSNPVINPLPIITSPARLLPRAIDDPEFVGWYQISTDDPFSELSCSSSATYMTSGSFAGCCDIGRSDCSRSMATSCEDSTLYLGSTSRICRGENSCFTNFIFPGSVTSDIPLFLVDCQTKVWEFFRLEPKTTSTSSPSSSPSSRSRTSSRSSSTSSSSRSSTTSVSNPANTGLTSASAPLQTANPTSPGNVSLTTKKKKSKAWIAGVVIGILALIAIAGFIFYRIQQRNKTNQQQSYQPAPQMQTSPMNLPQYQDVNAVYGPSAAAVENRSSLSTSQTAFSTHSQYGQPPASAPGSAWVPPINTVHELPELVSPPKNR